ncbi:MAG TPA: YdeI/OmpD-associated family protein [Gemmatimonadales bacterium]|nr:YdeI/OmpD-associated family protein [Gemmatimonadales bacterium]
MPDRDRRIDAYIARAPEFARPILAHLRAVIHQAVPEIEESVKWGMPSFGHHGILAGMAAFKQHCAFNLWKHALLLPGKARVGMGSFGRITSLRDLPPKAELVRLLRRAAKLNEAGVTSRRAKRPPRKAPALPADLRAGLARNARAKRHWDAFPPSARRDYVDWIVEAKLPATRAKRLKTTLVWVAAGKRRNWKYE